MADDRFALRGLTGEGSDTSFLRELTYVNALHQFGVAEAVDHPGAEGGRSEGR